MPREAAIGLVQLKRLERQTDTRYGNARYLKLKLQEIPEIVPLKLGKNVMGILAWQFPFRKAALDFKEYVERNRYPENDLLCQETVWFSPNMLLGSQADGDDIVRAVEGVHKSPGEIERASGARKSRASFQGRGGIHTGGQPCF
jgi:hypothetical protein